MVSSAPSLGRGYREENSVLRYLSLLDIVQALGDVVESSREGLDRVRFDRAGLEQLGEVLGAPLLHASLVIGHGGEGHPRPVKLDAENGVCRVE